MCTEVIAIADVGKTNKKFILFDADYRVVDEHAEILPEKQDDDGFRCEDIGRLNRWLKQELSVAMRRDDVDLKAVNFSAYGASLVHLDSQGMPVGDLDNYLKPYPDGLLEKFAAIHGDLSAISLQTASPLLGNLNSGLQLFRIRHSDPRRFSQIRQSLHLPQYLSWLATGSAFSETTSIGCHTMMWDFSQKGYHQWFNTEGFDRLMAPLSDARRTLALTVERRILSGIGLHDSSAALLPYLSSMTEPFMLLSTGTWSIALCPTNDEALTADELERDCLCYMSPEGGQVKASRMLLGMVHDREVALLAEKFHRDADAYRHVRPAESDGEPADGFDSAYRHLVAGMVHSQVGQIRLALGNASVRCMVAEGGFASNAVFMSALADALPEMSCYSADVPQGTALGAALLMGEALGWSASVPISLTRVFRTCY